MKGELLLLSCPIEAFSPMIRYTCGVACRSGTPLADAGTDAPQSRTASSARTDIGVRTPATLARIRGRCQATRVSGGVPSGTLREGATMAVLMILEWEGVGVDDYERVNEAMGI